MDETLLLFIKKYETQMPLKRHLCLIFFRDFETPQAYCHIFLIFSLKKILNQIEFGKNGDNISFISQIYISLWVVLK